MNAVLDQDVGVIFGALYDLAHDVDQAASFAVRRTVAAFGHQWAALPSGRFMLSDLEFKARIDDVIVNQEILIDRAWFAGKRVLDAGCGGGRWSYGLAKLGAHVTAVDTNPSAIQATRAALDELGAPAEFVLSEVESLSARLEPASFDLVWSWGVLHHCGSFTGALASLARLVKPGGLIHMYLYGRESVPLQADVRLFQERMRYNYLGSPEEQRRFLEEKARTTSQTDIHHLHDIYAPLINRRFEFNDVREMLERLDFSHIERTIDHTELWVRAVMGPDARVLEQYGLPKKSPPYWFQQ